MLLICADEATGAAHAMDGCEGWSEEMAERGVLLDGGGLKPPAEGKAVRVRRRETLLTDGPFAETKEQIGGYCFIECADMDEAVRVAAAHPAATYGTIAIREVWVPPAP
ncbi:MAG TPA: YciI family protein [Streptosporangiaceae bacterium]|nr:YciI family protein [Streptosporangiaceae bacterium]